MLSTLLPTVVQALRGSSPVTAVPPGPRTSAENKTIPVYHFDKFVKHAAVFGMEAAKERCFCYSLQNHFRNVLLWPLESSSKIEALSRELLSQKDILPIIGGML